MRPFSKENLATVFQLVVIIFIFSYTGPSADKPIKNSPDLQPGKVQYYQESKTPGLFFQATVNDRVFPLPVKENKNDLLLFLFSKLNSSFQGTGVSQIPGN